MRLTVDNLTHYDPSTLNLLLKGNSLITKAKSALTISGNEVIYNLTSAEKSSLGSGAVYVQLKTNDMQTEIVKVAASDLDGAIVKPFALAPSMIKKSGDTMTGHLYITKAGEAWFIAQNTNTGRRIEFGSSSQGNVGLYDATFAHYILYADSSGTVFYRDGYVSNEGLCWWRVRNTSSSYSHEIDLGVNATGGAGLYDRTHDKYLISSDVNGNVKLPSVIDSNIKTNYSCHIYMPVTKGTNPSSQASRGVYIYSNDSSNNNIGSAYSSVNTDGSTNMCIAAYRFTSGSTHYAQLRARITQSGSVAPYFDYYNGTEHSYTLWHQGTLPGANEAYANASLNDTITLSDVLAYGQIHNGSKALTLFVPYAVSDGTPTISNLSFTLVSRGGNFYVRSGSSGATYTNLYTDTVTSVWISGASARTNEVTYVSIVAKPRQGFQIRVQFNYAICSNNTGTTATNGAPVTARVTANIALS